MVCLGSFFFVQIHVCVVESCHVKSRLKLTMTFLGNCVNKAMSDRRQQRVSLAAAVGTNHHRTNCHALSNLFEKKKFHL